MSGTGELAARVDAAIREVPGVGELYFAAPLPARLWRVAVERSEAYTSIAERDGAYDVTASIGVERARADTVAGAVAARVREVLEQPEATVTVRVSRLSAARPARNGLSAAEPE